MAEGALFSTAEGIANSLTSLIGQEIGLVFGVKEELGKLKDTVSTIQAVLLDAEEEQPKRHAVKDWLRKLKDAMDDADNLLDDFSTEVLHREVMTRNKKAKEVRIFFSKSNPLAYGLTMGHRIKTLRGRLSAIADDRHQFHFTEHYKEALLEYRDRDHTHSFVSEEGVIGREDDKKAILELLMDCNERENVSIIPIVGIGGLGKTTLAQYVYGDEQVQRHFDLKMWVCVSESFDIKAVVEKIIESATEKRLENLEMNSLQIRLRQEIDGKKYLLVLDDVWNENRDGWISLKSLLMGGMCGSKILITTRSSKVAEITGTILPYLLRGLSDEDSWNLFKQMAFKDGEVPRPNLERMGREIVQKCAQVPLAIRTIGSLLYFKNSEVDWLYFQNNELSKINQEDDVIFPVLKLSYDHIPSHMKQCFAFCSLFPKDSEIEVQWLIKMWIAEGFIHPSDREKCLEDVGHEYFMHLLWRSFFQDIRTDGVGNVFTCKMHDLMHDLAQVVAGDECKIENSKAESVVEITRHVAFELDLLRDIPASLLKAKKMRTLFLTNQIWDFDVRDPLVYDTLISSFKCLRVLNLSNSNIREVPKSIGKLKHLRYFDLSLNSGIHGLPSSITQLLHLQTLRLDFSGRLKELPRDTKNLINLRHLELRGCEGLTHMPLGLGELKSLQTLSLYVLQKKGNVPTQEGGLSDLNELNGLRGTLRIKGLGDLRSSPQEARAANLKAKQFLQFLHLEWEQKAGVDGDKAMVNDELLLENLEPHPNVSELLISGYAGVKLSSWVSSLSNLVSITLVNCKWCECIPQLDQFPYLQFLHLEKLSSLEYISNDYSDQSVSSLKVLELENLLNLKGWCRMGELVTAEHEQHRYVLLLPSFPSLTGFYLDNCPKISTLSVMMTTPIPGNKTTSYSSSLFAFPRLEWLFIGCMDQLESLPEWMFEIISLKRLVIVECPNLLSLPEGMLHPTPLRHLRIEKCPHLEKRCQKGTGEDWPKVAHIPNFVLR